MTTRDTIASTARLTLSRRGSKSQMIAAANRLRKKRVLSDGDDEGVHHEQTSHTLLRMINRVHALPGVHARIDTAIAAAEGAKTALRPIRAKVLATDLDPDAQLARPHLRTLDMVRAKPAALTV